MWLNQKGMKKTHEMDMQGVCTLLVGMRDARAFTSLSHDFRDPRDHCYMPAHGTIAN